MPEPNFRTEKIMAGLVFTLSSSAFYSFAYAEGLTDLVFGGYAFIGIFLVLLAAAAVTFGFLPSLFARWQRRAEVLERLAVSSDGATVFNQDVDGDDWRRYLRVRREDQTTEEYWADEMTWHLCPPGTIVHLKVLGRRVIDSTIVKRAPKPEEPVEADAAD
jgi:hypothetical protein